MTEDRIDAATTKICGGQQPVAMWDYVLDTSNDDAYPFISYGQLLLRHDGVVFQRVHLSQQSGYEEWHEAPRAHFGGPHTIADVERIFSRSTTDYAITRIAMPDDDADTESDGFPAEYHSDVDGDRYMIVDAEDHDLTGWSVEVEKTDGWYQRFNWLPAGWTDRREFARTHPWYRSHKGSPWGYLRFSRDEVGYPWSALVDHGETVVRWIPPDDA